MLILSDFKLIKYICLKIFIAYMELFKVGMRQILVFSSIVFFPIVMYMYIVKRLLELEKNAWWDFILPTRNWFILTCII